MMTKMEIEATKALYAAAEKAGFLRDLQKAQVEVYFNGSIFYVAWEPELREHPDFVEPREALNRADAWCDKYSAKKGKKS